MFKFLLLIMFSACISQKSYYNLDMSHVLILIVIKNGLGPDI